MNIFVLDRCPDKSAQMMCDKHVIKMILESNQMLSTIARENGLDAPYRSTHSKHPCTIWAGKSKQNWNWLVQHSRALCQEYTKRYGKIHKSQRVTEWAEKLNISLPDTGQTEFALAMPAKYRVLCPVQSYRDYYKGDKARFASWRTGKAPDWW